MKSLQVISAILIVIQAFLLFWDYGVLLAVLMVSLMLLAVYIIYRLEVRAEKKIISKHLQNWDDL